MCYDADYRIRKKSVDTCTRDLSPSLNLEKCGLGMQTGIEIPLGS